MGQISFSIGAVAAAVIVLAGNQCFAGEPPKFGDDKIVAIYAQVNSFDIETALLAKSKNCDANVTALATHLSKDHLAVRKGVLELAEAENLGYALPSGRAAAQREHDAVMARLIALDCGAFEPAFLEHDVAFHTAAIDAVRNLLLPNAQNPKLKAHFEAVLPAFEKHLAMAKAAKDGRDISDTHGGH